MQAIVLNMPVACTPVSHIHNVKRKQSHVQGYEYTACASLQHRGHEQVMKASANEDAKKLH
jgi:glutamine phosphoribosylpyrophosphate amidotransferase